MADSAAGGRGRQEVVLRKMVGTGANAKEHYVVLNGESNDAITRGEGHEQADQMQLLYFVDSTSYVMDAGYDMPRQRGAVWTSSTWNPYYDHNVLVVRQYGILEDDEGYIGEDYIGGVESPYGSKWKRRVVSEHPNVDYIYGDTHGEITELSASIPLLAYTFDIILNELVPVDADYKRTVLFVPYGSQPVLWDINAAVRPSTGTASRFAVTYRGNSDATGLETQSNQQAYLWNNLYRSEDDGTSDPTDHQLLVQPFTFGAPSRVSWTDDTVQETRISEGRGQGVSVKVLDIESSLSITTAWVSVAAIRALPGTPMTRPPLAKANRVSPSPGPVQTWDYFTLAHSATEVDVLLVQEAGHFVRPGADVPKRRALIAEAGSTYVYLPGGYAYGFARLENTGGTWTINTDYQINNLQKAPLNVSIGGPACIEDGTEGFYDASAIGGRPPYSYNWKWYRICPEGARAPHCNAWSTLGSGSSVLYGGFNGEDFKIRVTVTDSESPTGSVTVYKAATVKVLSPMEGTCTIDGGIAGQSMVNGEEGAEERTETDEQKRENEAAEQADIALESEETLPEEYRLEQNYPNPFNAETVLRFALPRVTEVWLTVYDVLGRQVAEPVAGKHMVAGMHQVRLSSFNLPSGHYFYHLRSADHSARRRMVIAK